MNRRFLQTALVAALLSAGYPAYSLATRFLLSDETPRERRVQPVAADSRDNLTDRDTAAIVDRFLPDQQWAAAAGIQFRDEVNQFFYFAEDSAQTESKTDIRFEPLALVWFGKDSSEPLTIIADAAVLSFENEIRMPDPDPGRILGAELIGNVTIRGKNGVRVTGQHFIYSEKSSLIFSDNAVEFEYHEPGEKTGETVNVSGHADKGIEIRLDVTQAPDSDAMLAVEQMRELRLYQHVQVDFDVVQDGERIPLDISSKGGFSLEFQDNPKTESVDDSQMVATFRDRVRVYRRRTRADFDVLACDTLRLFLERSDGESQPAGEATDERLDSDAADESQSLASSRGVRFLWMSAVGDKVILHSVERQFTAIMKRLDHDPDRDRTWLNDLRFDPRYQQPIDGQLPPPRVKVRRGTSELECAQAEIRHSDEGGVQELICQGPGWLVHRGELDRKVQPEPGDSTGQQESETALTAQWQRQLRMFPDRKSQLDIIDLSGNVVVQMQEHEAGITADYVTVWMESTGDSFGSLTETNRQLDPSQVSRKGSGEAEKLEDNDETPMPRRLLAEGNVHFTSPKIDGDTDRLVAWFEELPQRPSQSTTPSATSVWTAPSPHKDDGSTGRGPQDSIGTLTRITRQNPRLRYASLRLDNEDEPAGDDQQAPALPLSVTPPEGPIEGTVAAQPPELDEPAKFRCEQIQLRIVTYGSDPPEVAEILTSGNVEMRQTRAAGKPETVLTGKQIHVTNRSGEDQDIHVFGSPAGIVDPSLELTGEHLSLFRRQNLMLVDGPGTLKLSVDRDFEGKQLETPEELTVQWVEQMSFDGQLAEFVGRVAASMKQSSMRCKQMTVTMAERMRFDSEAQQEPPEIDRIVCRYDVEVDSHNVEDGVLMQVVRTRFDQFAIDQQTGRAEALGPGVVRRWGRGTAEMAGLGPLAEVGANSGAEARPDGWEFTRIEFASKMIAHTGKKTMTFYGPVDVLYGPVDEPLETIDIDRLPKQGGLMSCDELDVLQRKLDNGQEYVELLAQGNATLEGRTFSAQSHEITYDGSKKLYTLRSRGDQHAVLVRKRRDGRRTRVVASAFRFIPSRDYFEVEKASVIQRVK